MVKKALVNLRSLYISTRLFISEIKKSINFIFTILSSFASLTVMILLILEFAFSTSMVRTKFFVDLHFYLISFYFIDDILRMLFLSKYKWGYFFIRPTDIAIIILFSDIIPNFPFSFDLFFSQMALFLILIGRVDHLGMLLSWFKAKPAQILIFTFLFVIFIFGLVLSLHLASSSVAPIAFVYALVTAFSAVVWLGLLLLI